MACQPECGAVVQAPEPPPAPRQDVPAIWMWILVLAAVLIFDLTMLRRHRWTMSRKVQDLARKHRWFRWFGVGVLAAFGWHLLWGF